MPPQASATSLHAVSLHTFPSSSPKIIFRIDISLPASRPFLSLIVSGPSTSSAASRTVTFLDPVVVPDLEREVREVSVCKLKWNVGKRAMEDASE